MKNVVTSIYAQMVYMIGMGLGFLLTPNIVLGLFGIESTSEIWIRVLGALVLVFSSFYYVMAKHEFLPLIKISVWERFLFCSILVVFALLQMGPVTFYLFAALEIGLALWTLMGLRRANL